MLRIVDVGCKGCDEARRRVAQRGIEGPDDAEAGRRNRAEGVTAVGREVRVQIHVFADHVPGVGWIDDDVAAVTTCGRDAVARAGSKQRRSVVLQASPFGQPRARGAGFGVVVLQGMQGVVEIAPTAHRRRVVEGSRIDATVVADVDPVTDDEHGVLIGMGDRRAGVGRVACKGVVPVRADRRPRRTGVEALIHLFETREHVRIIVRVDRQELVVPGLHPGRDAGRASPRSGVAERRGIGDERPRTARIAIRREEDPLEVDVRRSLDHRVQLRSGLRVREGGSPEVAGVDGARQSEL